MHPFQPSYSPLEDPAKLNIHCKRIGLPTNCSIELLVEENKVNSTNLRDILQFVNSVKRLVFDLTKLSFLKRLISISRLIVGVLNDQNLFIESNLAYWFLSYVQYCSGGHFSERAESAQWSGKMNHLNFKGLRCFL